MEYKKGIEAFLAVRGLELSNEKTNYNKMNHEP
jgi:hypothetical protein